MSKDLKLMFLASNKFDKEQVVRGGFLITDMSTKPLEFKCTNPIRPTLLQRTLYGEILDEHMLVELIGKPLVNNVKEKPSVILVRQKLFLKLRPFIDIPMLHIFKDTEISSDGSGKNEQANTVIVSDSGKFEPIIIATHEDFSKEREEQRAILSDVFHHHNLLQPFERIITALEQVHNNKVGEAQ